MSCNSKPTSLSVEIVGAGIVLVPISLKTAITKQYCHNQVFAGWEKRLLCIPGGNWCLVTLAKKAPIH